MPYPPPRYFRADYSPSAERAFREYQEDAEGHDPANFDDSAVRYYRPHFVKPRGFIWLIARYGFAFQYGIIISVCLFFIAQVIRALLR